MIAVLQYLAMMTNEFTGVPRTRSTARKQSFVLKLQERERERERERHTQTCARNNFLLSVRPPILDFIAVAFSVLSSFCCLSQYCVVVFSLTVATMVLAPELISL